MPSPAYVGSTHLTSTVSNLSPNQVISYSGTSGNLIILASYTNSLGGATISGITDNGGNTWHQAYIGLVPYPDFWYTNVTSPMTQITPTLNGGGGSWSYTMNTALAEYSNFGTISNLTQGGGNSVSEGHSSSPGNAVAGFAFFYANSSSGQAFSGPDLGGTVRQNVLGSQGGGAASLAILDNLTANGTISETTNQSVFYFVTGGFSSSTPVPYGLKVEQNSLIIESPPISGGHLRVSQSSLISESLASSGHLRIKQTPLILETQGGSILPSLVAGFQDPLGVPYAGGRISLQLSVDSFNSPTISAINSKYIVSGFLDSNGNIIQPFPVWPNDLLSPANTYYILRVYSVGGQLVWITPVIIPNIYPYTNISNSTPPVDTFLDVIAPNSGNFVIPHGLSSAPEVCYIELRSDGAMWFQPARYDGTNIYLSASEVGVAARVYISYTTVDAEKPFSSPAPGAFSVPHGLGVNPSLVLLQDINAGSIWTQTPISDATNVYLNASDINVLGYIEAYKTVPPLLGNTHVSLPLSPSAPGPFTVAHGLGTFPKAVIIKMKTAGVIHETTTADAINLYLTASDSSQTAIAEIWI